MEKSIPDGVVDYSILPISKLIHKKNQNIKSAVEEALKEYLGKYVSQNNTSDIENWVSNTTPDLNQAHVSKWAGFYITHSLFNYTLIAYSPVEYQDLLLLRW